MSQACQLVAADRSGAAGHVAGRRLTVTGRTGSRAWGQRLDHRQRLRGKADPLPHEPAHRQRNDGRKRDPEQCRTRPQNTSTGHRAPGALVIPPFEALVIALAP
jgi:hypothetical protein